MNKKHFKNTAVNDLYGAKLGLTQSSVKQIIYRNVALKSFFSFI